jgi:Holliday junction resolvase
MKGTAPNQKGGEHMAEPMKKKKKRINSKRKGKVGELELSKKLKEYGYAARRSVQYNGKEEEGQADVLGLPGVHIECKRTERLNLYDAVEQAKRDCEGKEQLPVVFHRKNKSEWLAIMTLDDFMNLYRELESVFELKGRNTTNDNQRISEACNADKQQGHDA